MKVLKFTLVCVGVFCVLAASAAAAHADTFSGRVYENQDADPRFGPRGLEQMGQPDVLFGPGAWQLSPGFAEGFELRELRQAMALLAGFLLNFMPCVLPVIGLKIMAFVQQSGDSRGRAL